MSATQHNTAGTRFYRLTTDRRQLPVALDDVFSGPQPSACFLVGGGPSLSGLGIEGIAAAPVPKMGINLSGAGLLRPTFWTSYDPTARFHRSVYLDPGVMKFVHRRRAMDVVPETTFKVCECPNLYFFDRDGERTYSDVLAPSVEGIVDWGDSMVQAIEILYRLGFRVIYLAGCEMAVRPSRAQIDTAAEYGVNYVPRERLREFLRRCEQAGLSPARLDAFPPGKQYHFNEFKPIRAAANSDEHYFRVTQFLRLSRRSMCRAGLQLISVTPHSRLNDHFPYRPLRDVLATIRYTVGHPAAERVEGLYRSSQSRQPVLLSPMRDVPPPQRSPRRKVNMPPRQAQRIRPPHNGNVLPRKDADDPEIIAEWEGFAPVLAEEG